MVKTAHIIGAGLSGLSAGVRLAKAGFEVHVHEATQYTGGRCRSYYDGATDMVIDNGNHLMLSGNNHVRLYATTLNTYDKLVGPRRAQFPFKDVANGKLTHTSFTVLVRRGRRNGNGVSPPSAPRSTRRCRWCPMILSLL